MGSLEVRPRDETLRYSTPCGLCGRLGERAPERRCGGRAGRAGRGRGRAPPPHRPGSPGVFRPSPASWCPSFTRWSPAIPSPLHPSIAGPCPAARARPSRARSPCRAPRCPLRPATSPARPAQRCRGSGPAPRSPSRPPVPLAPLPSTRYF